MTDKLLNFAALQKLFLIESSRFRLYKLIFFSVGWLGCWGFFWGGSRGTGSRDSLRLLKKSGQGKREAYIRNERENKVSKLFEYVTPKILVVKVKKSAST